MGLNGGRDFGNKTCVEDDKQDYIAGEGEGWRSGAIGKGVGVEVCVGDETVGE